MRITKAMLKKRAEYLNEITGNPLTYMTVNDSGDRVINVGHYAIGNGYGGYELEQVVNTGGGIRNVFNCGYVPARKLMAQINAYIQGLEDVRYGNVNIV